jgi:hypothetical protein
LTVTVLKPDMGSKDYRLDGSPIVVTGVTMGQRMTETTEGHWAATTLVLTKTVKGPTGGGITTEAQLSLDNGKLVIDATLAVPPGSKARTIYKHR